MVGPREAEEFVRQHHAEQDLASVELRVREVLPTSSAPAAARRNAATCVGRLPWSTLVVTGSEETEPTVLELPAEVARGLGLDTGPTDPYRRDLAQVELTRAVHHCVKRARVTVTDHRSEDERMITSARGTRRRGQRIEVEWAG